MIPLQTFSDPAMPVVLLAVFATLAVFAGFIWAFGKISEPPESHDEDEESKNGTHA
ncbi:hypothetical protein [Natronomonas sp.]|jgi:hypothetical protein|uniref:hypothetical protein n=1 Tax=Natronomonas sp. TaxID=2184060 RepID=UPI002FC376AB